MYVSNIEIHLNTAKHINYEMGRQERQARQGCLTTDLTVDDVHLASSVMNDTHAFRGRFAKVILSCGIILYRANGILRKFMEGEDSLDHSSNMRCDYVPELLALEEQELDRDLDGEKVSIVFDATPHMDNIFAFIANFVSHDETKAVVKLRMIYMSFVRGSLNAHLQCGEIQDGLQKVCLVHKDVTESNMDGCYTKIKSIDIIEKHQYIRWMKVL
jgi:hypothetical protein